MSRTGRIEAADQGEATVRPRQPGGGGPPERCRVIDPDGRVREVVLSADEHVALFHRSLYEGVEDLVEVAAAVRREGEPLRFRSRWNPGRFLPVADRERFVSLVARLRAAGLEVFAGPSSRSRPEPGRAAVKGGRVAWVDVDRPAELGRLRGFRRRPHLVVRSGGSGGVHAYWRLDRELPGEELEAVNRKLCARLGGDPSCVDRARIMRVPGTRNGKSGRWCRVVLADLGAPAHVSEQLCRGLDDPSPPRPPAPRRESAPEAADPVHDIPPPVYFERLTGTPVPERGGFVRCPFHDESIPSCFVYPEIGRGWWAYCCGVGGGPYDLASLLERGPWGRELRGPAFLLARCLIRAALR